MRQLNTVSITPTNPAATAPPPLGNAQYLTIAAFRSRLVASDGKGLAKDEMPSDAVRSWMTLRKSDLETALAPASSTDIRFVITKNFSVLAASGGRGEDDIRGAQLVYVEDLFDVPNFALQKACSDIRRRIVGVAKWAPSPGEIRHRAMEIAGPFFSELADLRAILGAKVDSEARLEASSASCRLRSIVSKVVDDVSAFPPAKRALDMRTEPKSQREASDRLIEMRYADRPLSISDELMRILDLPGLGYSGGLK